MKMLGSPPRVRERHLAPPCPRPVYGITPACAGKTPGIIFSLEQEEDHPRVCGKDDN